MESDRYMVLGTGSGFDRVGDDVSALQGESHAYQKQGARCQPQASRIAFVWSMSAVEIPWLLIVMASDTCAWSHPHGEL